MHTIYITGCQLLQTSTDYDSCKSEKIPSMTSRSLSFQNVGFILNINI